MHSKNFAEKMQPETKPGSKDTENISASFLSGFAYRNVRKAGGFIDCLSLALNLLSAHVLVPTYIYSPGVWLLERTCICLYFFHNFAKQLSSLLITLLVPNGEGSCK